MRTRAHIEHPVVTTTSHGEAAVRAAASPTPERARRRARSEVRVVKLVVRIAFHIVGVVVVASGPRRVAVVLVVDHVRRRALRVEAHRAMVLLRRAAGALASTRGGLAAALVFAERRARRIPTQRARELVEARVRLGEQVLAVAGRVVVVVIVVGRVVSRRDRRREGRRGGGARAAAAAAARRRACLLYTSPSPRDS